MERRSYRFVKSWAFPHRAPSLFVLLMLCVNIGAIRVYEGTTNERMLGVKLGKSLSNSTISKRSWSPSNIDIEESTGTLERRMDENWREIDRKSTSIRDKEGRLLKVTAETKSMPTLYKIKLTQRGYIQFLKYIANVPPLQEYTFCLWFMSKNLTHSHPLFSYSKNEKERIIGFWLYPPDSTLRMGIRNEIIFKVPVSIRENRWYHVCQSWSGLTGDWIVFVDGKKKGAGRILKYQGTFIPGGGDVVVGQEITDADKGLDDGVEGEIFGFNMVDEAVDLKDQAMFLNPNSRLASRSQTPKTASKTPQTPQVPPFKTLPPMKKSFQDIQAYLSTLPYDPREEKRVPTLTEIADEPNLIKTDDVVPASSSRIVRQKPKMRYKPPVRKVVEYRQDRQLGGFESRKLNTGGELLKKTGKFPPEIETETPGNDIEDQTEKKLFKVNQIYDENYSIHTYRIPKEKIRVPAYEIYEIPVEEEINKKPLETRKTERKIRQNFDVFTARENNKMYPAIKYRESKSPKYHFEIRREAPSLIENQISRRSLDLEENLGVTKRNVDKYSALPDYIPVYEVIEDDTPFPRRKRDLNGKREGRHVETETATGYNEFRRLPQIPESFINLFAGRTPKTEIEEKLKEFFPEKKNETTQPTIPINIPNLTINIPNIPSATGNNLSNTESLQILDSAKAVMDANNLHNTGPLQILDSAKAAIQEEQLYMKEVSKKMQPQNFPDEQELEQIYQKGNVDRSSVHSYVDENRRRYVPPKVADANVEKGKIEVSSGTELVIRGYGQCSVERGSPIRNKKHVVISWSETPVRIFGGAMVANAKNSCGHF